jgi:2-hydroxy-3-oxopropionate reductase
MTRKISFIGLGIMGKPMALNLIKAGHSLTVNDLNQDAVQTLLEAGATAARSAKEAAANSEIIITMLPASKHVQAVVLGDNGILAGAKKGSIIIDMSSITPAVTKALAEEAAKRGVGFLDAPVSGGEPKAIDGTLAIMVGGNEDPFYSIWEVQLH